MRVEGLGFRGLQSWGARPRSIYFGISTCRLQGHVGDRTATRVEGHLRM